MVNRVSAASQQASDCKKSESIELNRMLCYISLPICFEVEIIIRQVDGTFRNKREECKRLEWEISDLQNQLREIVKNTEEYAEIAASEGAALSWAKQLLSAAELDWDDLCFARLDEFAATRKRLDESLEKGIVLSTRFELCIFF